MTDEQNNMETIDDTNQNEEATQEQPQIEDIDETDTIQKPRRKKGRPPLTQKQKEALAKGRAISRRNMQKLQAEHKLKKIAEEERSEIDTVKEEPQEKVKPTVNKKKPKKKIFVQSESESDDSSEDEIIYVSKKKKKKPKKKVYISSSSDDDDSSDEEYPPQPQQPRLIFR